MEELALASFSACCAGELVFNIWGAVLRREDRITTHWLRVCYLRAHMFRLGTLIILLLPCGPTSNDQPGDSVEPTQSQGSALDLLTLLGFQALK